MTIEEKAHAYDVALARAKGMYESRDDAELAAYIFPELTESEDERIRKWLIKTINLIGVDKDICADQETMDKAIAWLEKQKEPQEIPLMNGDADLYFDNWRQKVPVPTFRQCFEEGMRYAQRLQKEQKPVECLKAERDGWYVCIKDFYAGGKKQCSVGDLVQAKGGMYMMGKEDISEWFRRAYYEDVRDAFGPNTDTNIPEQKPAWQEVKGRRGRIGDTPEYIRKKAENFLSKMEPPYDADDICSAYETGAMENAKSAEWKPTEEQFNYLAKAIMTLGEKGDCRTAGVLNEIRNGLKCSFPDWKMTSDYPKEGCNVSLNGEIKKIQEWSEEDEHRRNDAIYFLESAKKHYADTSEVEKTIDWLKSLRPHSKVDLVLNE